MKRIGRIFIVLLVLYVLHLCAFATPDVTVTLNGNVIDCASYGQPATIAEGRTLVPLRAVFEAIGADVEWHEPTRTVTSYRNGTVVKLIIGEKRIYINGKEVPLDVEPRIINDRTVVPVRAVAEAFGVKVDWDAESYTVIMTFDTYFEGFVSANKYFGKWTGINYEPPENFSFFDDGTLCEFMVSDGNGNSLYFAVDENAEGISDVEYLALACEVYKDTVSDYMAGNPYDTVVADIHVKAIDVEFSFLGTKIMQSIAVYRKESGIVSLTFTYKEKDAYLKLLGGFSKYEKPSFESERVDLPDKHDSSQQIKVPLVSGAKERIKVFGNFSLGMTMAEMLKSAKGEKDIYNTYINIWDTDGIYADEDETVVGKDVNCDFMHLEFGNSGLDFLYVSSEYSDKAQAAAVLENVKACFGDGYTSGEINAGCTWLFENYSVYAETVYETLEDKYYTFICFTLLNE